MLLLTGALATAACADHVLEPVPGERTPAVPGPARAFVSPVSDAVLSAPALRIPGSNAVLFGATAWTDLPAEFGDAQWVELRTVGEVSWTINEAAGEAAKYWNCYGSNAFAYYGEGSTGGGGLGGGELRVAATVADGKPSVDDYGAVMLSEGDQVYRLARVWPGARLYGRRTGLGGVCNGVPWYFFEGEHRVEVRKVVPVQVKADRETFTAGEVLTWTTKLYRDLTRLSWTFERPDGTIEYPECSGESCAYAPRGPGRMKLSARWERASPTVYVEGYSPPVTNQPAKLKLTCTDERGGLNRVIRGENINCTASKDPVDAPGELRISGWSFEGNARSDGDVTSTQWSGVMVEDGRVEVRGTIGEERAEPGRAVIRVESRSWVDSLRDARIVYDVCAARTRTCLQSPPVEYQDLGKTYLTESEYTLPARNVNEGPNAGWWYFTGEVGPVQLPRPVTLLHPDVFDPGSAFYKTRSCNPARVQTWITTHERTHVEIGRTQLAQTPLNPWLEQRRVYRPQGPPNNWYNAAVRRVRDVMRTLMDPNHQLEWKYPSVPCDLRLANNTPSNP
jgi:hypothetical protein